MKQRYTNPLIPDWSVRKAIVERVEYEDTVRWARQKTRSFSPVPELPDTRPPVSPFSLFVFLRNFSV